MPPFSASLPAFKAYDIRGLREQEIDTEFAYILGLSIGKHFAGKTVLVGMDTRVQNPALLDALSIGLQQHHVHVLIAGLSPQHPGPSEQINPWGYASTSLMYALAEQADLGIVLSASHNPPQYVGFKAFTNDLVFTPTSTLKQWCQETVDAGYTLPEVFETHHELIDEQQYVSVADKLLPYFTSISEPVTIVVDYSNGAGCAFEQQFLSHWANKYNHTLIELNNFPDGEFRAHHSDTSDAHNYIQLKEAVHMHHAAIGVMFDGDADRLGIVDHTGEIIPGDLLLAVIIQQLGIHGEAIVFDVMGGFALREVIRSTHNEPVVCRMGRFFINEKMQQTQAVLGGEVSGHIMFGEWGNAENTLIALAYLLQSIQARGPLHEQVTRLTNGYYREPMRNIQVTDPDQVIASVLEEFADFDPLQIDGLNIFTENLLLTIRKSNTEPLIRIQLETTSKELFDKTMERINRYIV